MLFIRKLMPSLNVTRFEQGYSLEELVILCYYANLYRLQKSNLRITYSLRHENVVTITTKRRLSTLIFACLCFKKSFLIRKEHNVISFICLYKSNRLNKMKLPFVFCLGVADSWQERKLFSPSSCNFSR